MRRIKTKEEQEKKDKRNKTILGVIIGFIMIFSTAGYAFFNQEGTSGTDNSGANIRDYKGFSFIQDSSGLWITQLSGYTFSFKYAPWDVENISPNIKASLNDYADKPLYLSGNGVGSDGGKVEIARNLAPFVQRVQDACISGDECTDDLPVKNCTSDSIFVFKSGVEDLVFSSGSCLIVNYNITADKISDALIYKIIGITP